MKMNKRFCIIIFLVNTVMSLTAFGDQQLMEITRAETGDSLSPCNENPLKKQTHCKCGQQQTLFSATEDSDYKLECYNNEKMSTLTGCKFFKTMSIHDDKLHIGHDNNNSSTAFDHAEVWMFPSAQRWQRVEEGNSTITNGSLVKMIYKDGSCLLVKFLGKTKLSHLLQQNVQDEVQTNSTTEFTVVPPLSTTWTPMTPASTSKPNIETTATRTSKPKIETTTMQKGETKSTKLETKATRTTIVPVFPNINNEPTNNTTVNKNQSHSTDSSRNTTRAILKTTAMTTTNNVSTAFPAKRKSSEQNNNSSLGMVDKANTVAPRTSDKAKIPTPVMGQNFTSSTHRTKTSDNMPTIQTTILSQNTTNSTIGEKTNNEVTTIIPDTTSHTPDTKTIILTVSVVGIFIVVSVIVIFLVGYRKHKKRAWRAPTYILRGNSIFERGDQRIIIPQEDTDNTLVFEGTDGNGAGNHKKNNSSVKRSRFPSFDSILKSNKNRQLQDRERLTSTSLRETRLDDFEIESKRVSLDGTDVIFECEKLLK
ncbi:transcription initiation factor TFIID subunit 12-like [Clytia hemisphaerica]|uniref:Cnidarian restricted protein n=1 Tax=Clytia hemisphaerica TaxID=252671 RepID=A0A7M5XIT8_9CNID